MSQPTRLIEMADPITYMNTANEATLTRNALTAAPYSEYKIFHTTRGTNPYVYPVVDWMDMLIKPQAFNQRVNMNISGGGNIARYYVAGSLTRDNGILRVDNRNSFNNNIKSNKYLLHMNFNINLSKETELIVRMHGTFNDYQGPLTGGSDLYKQILLVSPVDYPAYYEPVGIFKNVEHILFGGEMAGSTYELNPYAEMLKGYQQKSNSAMMAQVELKHNFGKWIKGLKGRIMGNTQRYGGFDMSMQYTPFYYRVSSYDLSTDTYDLFETNPSSGTYYLRYSQGDRTVNYSMYGDASLNYNRIFGKIHDVSGMLVGIIRHTLSANASSLVDALPERNLGLSGRFTYGFDKRYAIEANFGYNGSEKFDKGHRFGFFPSMGISWNVSNEKFWTENLKQYVNKLKIRGTYGLVGNDAIGSQRFFYISVVNPSGGGSIRFGSNFTGRQESGYSISNYPNSNITWEVSKQSNLGIEVSLFDSKLEIQTDIFRQHRTNILQTRADVPIEQGLWSAPQVNIGEAIGKGVDMSVDYKQNFKNGLWFVARGNFTFARSKYEYYEEAQWEMIDVPWKSKKGRPVKQTWGLIAEHLFIDDSEVAASARQEFSRYQAGDIKYKDMNGDGVINTLDEVPIGYPTTPEINYGFGLSAGYKGFDFSFFFSGSARSSFFIDPEAITPFILRTSNNARMRGGLTQMIADDHWTEASQNPNAFWPRLSDVILSNNTRTSNWWMYDGPFLRLKSVEIGYSLPYQLSEKLRMRSARVYLSGTNLLLFSKFKLWDIEMGKSGLNYPLQRVFNVGINVSF